MEKKPDYTEQNRELYLKQRENLSTVELMNLACDAVVTPLQSQNERLLSALKEREWIDVKERYPGPLDADSKGYVLGWDKFQQESHKCQWVDVCQMKMRFTHWQPLPSPPKQLINEIEKQ